jgi:hypothetical protein
MDIDYEFRSKHARHIYPMATIRTVETRKTRMLNFKTCTEYPSMPEELRGRTDLRLMLWAGDCYNKGVTDVERLPGYDIYLCYGLYNTHLDKNVDYLKSRSLPGCICVIDVNSDTQMDIFIQLFRNSISWIDSDYNGTVPSFNLCYYSDLLRGDGTAYHIQPISYAFYPTIALSYALELFAPILPPLVNDKRIWTKSIRDLAKWNEITCLEAFTSPDFKDKSYDYIRQEQDKFKTDLYNLNNHASDTRNYENALEEYWDILRVDILCVDLSRAFKWEDTPSYYINQYKRRFADYLKKRIMSKITGDECMTDFEQYCSENAGTEDQEIRSLQNALEYFELAAAISSYPLLHANVCYFIDERRRSFDPESTPPQEYGVVISKV